MPTIETRVTGLYFDAGDRIGLTVMMDGSGPYVENRMMTYNGSTFTSPGFLWYNDLNVTSTLTAYYPYSATGTPEEFHIETDQTAGCASSDLLGAVKRGVTPASAPVGMVFYHLFTQLSIRVNNVSDASVTGITVGGTVTTAAVDLSVPTASALEGAAAEEITVFTVTPDEEYRVILVPQQGTLTVTVRTDDGKSRSRTISSTLLESGKRYDLSVEVTNIDISLSLSGEISDWEDGGSLDDGNGGSGSGDVTVTDGTISHAGETYRTVWRSTAGSGWPRTCAACPRVRRWAAACGILRAGHRPYRRRACSTTMPRRRRVRAGARACRCRASVRRAGTCPTRRS